MTVSLHIKLNKHFWMKIYHPKYKNIAILFCNKDDVIGHVKIDGMPVSSGDPGFSRELGEFCFFFALIVPLSVYTLFATVKLSL